MNEPLYHYCSVDSMFNILSSRVIWLSDARHTNDHKEVTWLHDLLVKCLNHKITEENKLLINKMWDHFIINKVHPFIFCMSEKPDILSQWRSYASNGEGVAIGFNREIFGSSVTLSGHRISSEDTTLHQVIYNSASQEGQINNLVDLFLSKASITQEAGIDGLIAEFCYTLSGLSTFMKNPAFEEEKEWRAIHTPMILTNESNENHIINSGLKVKQRVYKNDIYTYFEKNMPHIKNETITEIWLGPNCRLSYFDLSLFFSINNYGNIAVYRSSASYRQ